MPGALRREARHGARRNDPGKEAGRGRGRDPCAGGCVGEERGPGPPGDG